MPIDERVARSVALEQTYVHDVYEQFYDNPRSRPWPKIQRFLDELEPGSLVCDVGCGNGKYLNLNSSIFSIGGEKSNRLSELAREKNNEIIQLDNLALPFRDNSLDAVLSISVVHHLATTERRVCALRELARVMRIGGKLIITVWAMEQNHRKFESQDVLVPWRKPKHVSTPSLELTSTTNTSEDDGLLAYHAYSQTSDSDSSRSFRSKMILRRKTRSTHRRGRSIDPGHSPSPSGSSLTSPNETCYSFVRRAIQKLAGGGRRVVSHRPWFLESWRGCSNKESNQKTYDPDGCECCDCYGENMLDVPIELRRIDDEEPTTLSSRRQTFPSSQLAAEIGSFKSRSMTNIKSSQENNNTIRQDQLDQIVTIAQKTNQPAPSNDSISRSNLPKPKLIKQKRSICDEDDDEALDQPTDMKTLISALPVFRTRTSHTRLNREGMMKQRSLNEEMLSTERLKEKERLKKNIQKQTSMNDELIYHQRSNTFDSIKDTFFSASTTKKFQLIKTELTNKIKNSTTNMEKVTGATLKNGFVKIFQNWKSVDLVSPTTNDNELIEIMIQSQTEEKKEETTERRHSKEEGSDSSKDSSLQSDTSVDSEDSFASVIFVPKSDPMSPAGVFSPGPASPYIKSACFSAPQSPRLKQSSCPTSPRIKQTPLMVYPLTKQLSSPRPSTELLSTAFFGSIDKEVEKRIILKVENKTDKSRGTLSQKYSVAQIPQFRETSLNTPEKSDSTAGSHGDHSSSTKQVATISPEKTEEANQTETPTTNVEAAIRNERLKKIRELLAQKPGFGVKSTSSFPMVRQASVNNGKVIINPPHQFHRLWNPVAPDGIELVQLENFTNAMDSIDEFTNGPSASISVTSQESKMEAIARPIPRLLTLELFNPETDDIDSDSSCVSSPDSVESVVSVRSSRKNVPASKTGDSKSRFQFTHVTNRKQDGKSNMSLLEAVVNVATSLDEAVDKVIKAAPIKSRSKLPTGEVLPILQRGISSDALLSDEASNAKKWNEDCHKHLTQFADRLSEKLLKEIDEYQETHHQAGSDDISDPYIHRLSKELDDLSKLSAEIQKQNEYLDLLSASDNTPFVPQNNSANSCTGCKKKSKCECKSFDNTAYRTKNRTKTEVLASLASGGSKVLRVDDVSRVQSDISNSKSDKYSVDRGVEGSSTLMLNGISTKPLIRKGNSSDSCDSSDKGSSTNSIASSVATSINMVPSMGSSKDSSNGTSNGGSTASLVSLESKTSSVKNRLEPTIEGTRQAALKRRDCSTLSDASQDSLPSDTVGGEITYHRFYHVFREGELDQLIEKYVENLHIISSYYDHSSWCIVAEKVQVWTI